LKYLDATVVTPSIAERGPLLQRALRSVHRQTLKVTDVAIAFDVERLGSGPTRTRALRSVRSRWTLFLDDDDELLPHHVDTLHRVALQTGADVVTPWFVIIDPSGTERPDWDPWATADAAAGVTPRPHRQYDWRAPHIFPITCLVRTELAQLGTFPAHHVDGWGGDDFAYWQQLGEAGAVFHQIPDITWHWHHHGRNTSGLVSKREAIYG
jgi:hypothetical protein